jgi:hypothetical protein
MHTVVSDRHIKEQDGQPFLFLIQPICPNDAASLPTDNFFLGTKNKDDMGKYVTC